MDLDIDLKSVQEARCLVKQARQAFLELKEYDQGKIDKLVQAMAEAAQNNSRCLAEMAVEETGFGVLEDKVAKNLLASEKVYQYIKDMKTVGFIGGDPARKVLEVAEPVGVIAGILPTTNPTSTLIYKSLIAIKSRNTIVFSPHPAAVKCTLEAAKVLTDAARAMGAPPGIIGSLSIATMDGNKELINHPDVDMILATGGAGMVKAAYSTGKPAYGVGPGNVPAFIERTADIPRAVADIMVSKTFDNGTICSSEQAIVTEEVVKEKVIDELRKAGCYMLNPNQKRLVEGVLAKPSGGLNPAVVGQTAQRIAAMAGFNVPDDVRVLVAEETGVGRTFPFSMEKLSPVLALYTAGDWHSACAKCIEILNYGGIGHTLVIHSKNEEIIKEFALKKPVSRILVNTPSTHGAVGISTGLAPSLTLGCGSWGKNSTGDNITPLHLITIKRLAYGLEQISDQKVPSGLNQEMSEDMLRVIIAQVMEKIAV